MRKTPPAEHGFLATIDGDRLSLSEAEGLGMTDTQTFTLVW